MQNIKRCSRCILPISLINITIGEDGVCNHCLKYEKDFKNWDLIKDRKEQQFKEILARAQALKRPYDCLVPLSGGKDSTFALYLCAKIYKLKTLAVTFDNGYLSNPAKENIKNALSCCDADHIFYKVNKKNASELFSVFLENTGDFCNACMRGINYSTELATRSFRIPLVIRGSGRRVQYVSQIKEASSLNTASYFANVLKNTKAEKKFAHFAGHKHRLEIQKILGGVCDIIKIPRTFLMRFMTQHIGLYDYIYKPFPEVANLIRAEMQWNDGSKTLEHLDCELHDIPFYKNTLRIDNITMNTFYRSGLIRQGLLSRDEALKMEEEELNENKAPEELNKFLADNTINYQDYIHYVKDSIKSQYEPKIQKISRNIYHKFRKY